MRNCHSTSAGKPFGVSCTPGRMSCATTMTATKAATASDVAFHAPSRASSPRRMRAAASIASIVIVIIATNSAVRRSIVAALPTDGGLAGYFVNGTSVIVRYAPSASTAAVARAPSAPMRP